MKLLVYTATFGDTDTVRAPDCVIKGVDYLCFGDRPCVAPYEWIPVAAADEKPHVAARRFKILATHPRLQDADMTLWHDASYRLVGDLKWLWRGLKHADLVAMFHPRRTRIEDEAVAIARYGYLQIERALDHVARYRAAGFTDHVVTSPGILGRRRSSTIARFNALWWEEMQQWGGRDQGSVDYAAWATKVRVAHLPGTVRANPYAEWRVTEAVTC